MLLAIRPANRAIIAAVVRIVVIADFLFTVTTVANQALTGALFAWDMGFSLKETGLRHPSYST